MDTSFSNKLYSFFSPQDLEVTSANICCDLSMPLGVSLLNIYEIPLSAIRSVLPKDFKEMQFLSIIFHLSSSAMFL